MTVWKTIAGYPLYEVNQYGEVRNRKTGHIKKPRTDGWGYQQVTLNKGLPGSGRSKTVHRLVANAFYDGDHSNLQVNHIDGNKQNNFIGNLEFVTGSENVQHAYDSGLRKPSGGRGRIRRVRIVETGEEFDNMAECARHIHGDSGNVSRCVRDKTKTYKGLHYEEVDEQA